MKKKYDMKCLPILTMALCVLMLGLVAYKPELLKMHKTVKMLMYRGYLKPYNNNNIK